MAPSAYGEDKAKSERDWMGFITALLFRGTLGYDEILAAPLPRLNAIHGALVAEYCKNLGVSPDGGPEEAGVYPEEMSREAYFQLLNGSS